MAGARDEDPSGWVGVGVVCFALAGVALVIRGTRPAAPPEDTGVVQAARPPAVVVAAPEAPKQVEPDPERELTEVERGRVEDGRYVVGEGEEARSVATLDRATIQQVGDDHLVLEDGRVLPITGEDKAKLPYGVTYGRSETPPSAEGPSLPPGFSPPE